MKKYLVPFFILLLTTISFAYTSPGKPSGHVNDFAGILTQSTRTHLEQDLRRFAREHHHQIAVVTISSLGGDSIENYANTLYREWGLGLEEKNNGVLFLVAVNDRKMRIEVGYGLEGALTDIETHDIQEKGVKPYFKQGKFDAGIREGTRQIQTAIIDEKIFFKPPTRIWHQLLHGFIFLFLLFSIILKIENRWYGVYIGASSGFVVAFLWLSISEPWSVAFFVLIGGLLSIPAMNYLLREATWELKVYQYIWKTIPLLFAIIGFILSVTTLNPIIILIGTVVFAGLGLLTVRIYKSRFMDALFSLYTLYVLWLWLTLLELFPNKELAFLSITFGTLVIYGFYLLLLIGVGLILLMLIVSIIDMMRNPGKVFIEPSHHHSRRSTYRYHAQCSTDTDQNDIPRSKPKSSDSGETFKGFGGGSSGGGGSSSSW